METVLKQPAKGLKVFDAFSTNAITNWWQMLASAAAIVIGLEENIVLGAIGAVPLLYQAIQELIKKTRKPVWNGNVITYLFGGLALLIPSFAGIIESLQPVAEYLLSGGPWTGIFALMLPVINQIVVWVQTQNNPTPA